MAKATVISVGASVLYARSRSSYLATLLVATGFVMPILSAPASAYDSSSGPRVRGFGAVVAPVDRLGPTMRADPFLLPDSGWNGSGTGGARGNGGAGTGPYTPTLVQPLPVVAPAPPPPVVTPSAKRTKKGKGHKSHGRIILQKPNG